MSNVPFMMYDGHYTMHNKIYPETDNFYQYFLIGLVHYELDYKTTKYGINGQEILPYNGTDRLISNLNGITIESDNEDQLYLITKAGRYKLSPKDGFILLVTFLIEHCRMASHAILHGSVRSQFDYARDFTHYESLLNITIDYCNQYGISTGVDQDVIFDPTIHTESRYWKHSKMKLESCKRSYHKIILDALITRAPIVVTGGTGTGKTKVIPKLIWFYNLMIYSIKQFFRKLDKNSTVLAFPKRSLARTNTLNYLTELGYSDPEGSPFNLIIGKKTKITLTNTSLRHPAFVIGTSESLFTLSDIMTLIIDEFHEHDMKSDFLFTSRKSIHKAVITATPTSNDYQYFERFMPGYLVCHIDHSMLFPVDVKPIKDYNSIRDAISKLRLASNESAMVFLPTKDIIHSFVTEFSLMNSVAFYGANSTEATARIIELEAIPKSFIVFATTAAESSITIPSLTYVIDSGLDRKPESQFKRFKTLIWKTRTSYINYSRYLQRRGRLGRLKPGVFIPAYDPEKLSRSVPMPFDNGNSIGYVILIIAFKATIDNIMLEFTQARWDKLHDILLTLLIGDPQDILLQISGKKPFTFQLPFDNATYMSWIQWPESIKYMIDPNVTKADKEQYMQLWDRESDETKNEIFSKIVNKDKVPRKIVRWIQHNRFKLISDDSEFEFKTDSTLDTYKTYSFYSSEFYK